MIEFRMVGWASKGYSLCNAGAVMLGKLDDDGRMFYKTCECNEWREIVPRELVADVLGDKSCPSWYGNHDKIRWAMHYHFDELKNALLNRDEKFSVSSIGYGHKIFDINYVVGYDVQVEDDVTVADIMRKGSLQTKSTYAGDEFSVIYITYWNDRNIIKRVVDKNHRAECSVVYEF